MSTEPVQDSRSKQATAPEPDDPRKPDSPGDLSASAWRFTVRSAWREFKADQATDLAAALTYYTLLSLFPALLALVGVLAIFGQSKEGTQVLLDIVRQVAPGDAAEQLAAPLDSMVGSSANGLALMVGLAAAVWSASGYVRAFGRAMNRVYEVDEGRPIWKLAPQQLLLTLALLVGVAVVVVALAVSGPIARAIGDVAGLGESTVRLWDILKWPVLLVLIVLLVAVLYHFTPNVRQPKFRWISVGAVVAITIWVVASVLFGLYVANFAHYNRTYGALAGVIVLLLWLYLTNLALLFGAEIDSELERARELEAGIAAETTIQLPPRDTRQSDKVAAQQARAEADARAIRDRARTLAQQDEVEAARLGTPRPYADQGLDEDGFVAG